MTPSLPPRPSLEQLRNQAKDLLRAHKAADASCCGVLRRLKQFEGKPDAAILAGHVSLVEVQYALAMDYGFRSWQEMRKAVGSDAPRSVDLSSLCLRGNCQTQDLFSLTFKAAAELLGRKTDYETIHALSTNAFSPGINPREDCMSWWHHGGRDVNMDMLAEFLGLRLSPVKVAGLAVSPAQSHDEFNRVTAEQRRQFPALMQEVMSAGGIVMVDGGWASQAKGLVPWVFWGIITQAESGAILGASFNGRNDNPIEYVDGCWGVYSRNASLSQGAADLRMLRLARERIRGEGAFSRGRLVYGLPAMDLWIRQMENVQGFCPGCFQSAPDRAWGDAHDAASTAYHGALTVSSYLGKRLDAFPQPARPHVAATARRYAAVAELLKPALTGNGGPHYRDFIGDLDRQKHHARTVLVPLRDEMVKAADEIDKTLAASTRAGAGQDYKGGRI